MREKKSAVPSSNIGIASLLVIFIILCLVVFSALSLSTARNDYSHSVDLSLHRTTYYNASNTSEQIIATIAKQGANESAVNEALSGEDIDTKVSISGGIASWSVPIGTKQKLSVEINCSGLNVNKWKVEPLKGE